MAKLISTIKCLTYYDAISDADCALGSAGGIKKYSGNCPSFFFV